MATCVPPAAAAAASSSRCSRAASLLLLAALLALAARAPAPAAAQKIGSCPPPAGVHVCVFKCYDDADCRGEQKCCKTLCGGSMCMNSVTAPRPRPPVAGSPQGVCPAVSSTPWVCRSRCSSDQECLPSQKCCQHRCGGYSCLTAVVRPQRDAADPAGYEPEYSVVGP